MVTVGLVSPVFVSGKNMLNILFQISINGIIAVGMTYLLIGGDFDLSVGSNMVVAATMLVILEDFGPIISIFGALFVSTLAGYLNGIMVAKFKVNSFVTTLSMMFLLRGIILILTNNRTIVGESDIYFKFGYGTAFGIPYPGMVFIIFNLIFGVILARTVYGRRIYAVGSNEEAAQLFGINVAQTKIFAFVMTGALCGIAGIILFSRINSASGIYGMYTNLDVLTAVFLGGTSLYGGKGSIFKTLKGIVVLGLLSNATTILGVNPFLQQVIKGVLLVIAVIIDTYKRKN
jgi:ribose/xylose/arabinose/galactoside ABC-type transport system permease subunit